MLNHPKHALGLARRQQVVKGGSQVKEHDGGNKEDNADHEWPVADKGSMQDEPGRANQCGKQPDTMAEAVCPFFRG
ncbi:hypothetical protein GCM10022394_12880 [Zobellella aerophila]|uniref:Uncharacterized protein n=1 Tax=Zobellella aerophila TaxID=870480 RepID=A0ABP6VF96_9GAMM